MKILREQKAQELIEEKEKQHAAYRREVLRRRAAQAVRRSEVQQAEPSAQAESDEYGLLDSSEAHHHAVALSTPDLDILRFIFWKESDTPLAIDSSERAAAASRLSDGAVENIRRMLRAQESLFLTSNG